jgi:hypothetical protein
MHLSDPPFLPPHPSATTHGAAAAGGARTMQDETRQLLTSETWSVQLLCNSQQVQLRLRTVATRRVYALLRRRHGHGRRSAYKFTTT